MSHSTRCKTRTTLFTEDDFDSNYRVVARVIRVLFTRTRRPATGACSPEENEQPLSCAMSLSVAGETQRLLADVGNEIFFHADYVSTMNERVVPLRVDERGAYVITARAADARTALDRFRRVSASKLVTPRVFIEWFDASPFGVLFVPEAWLDERRVFEQLADRYDPRTGVVVRLELVYSDAADAVWCDGYLQTIERVPTTDERLEYVRDVLQRADEAGVPPHVAIAAMTAFDDAGRADAERTLEQRRCARCAADNARSKCSRCIVTRYCGAECQRAHWSTHRGECRQIKWVGEALRQQAVGRAVRFERCTM